MPKPPPLFSSSPSTPHAEHLTFSSLPLFHFSLASPLHRPSPPLLCSSSLDSENLSAAEPPLPSSPLFFPFRRVKLRSGSMELLPRRPVHAAPVRPCSL